MGGLSGANPHLARTLTPELVEQAEAAQENQARAERTKLDEAELREVERGPVASAPDTPGPQRPWGASTLSVQPAATGHSIPRSRGLRSALAEVPRFWRNPAAAVRRWRWAHRYPRPTDFDKMAAGEFDAYVRDTGFDARITAALAESNELVGQADTNANVGRREGTPTA
jgi:hypothetical protein